MTCIIAPHTERYAMCDMTQVSLEFVIDWLRENLSQYQYAANDYLLDSEDWDHLITDLKRAAEK